MHSLNTEKWGTALCIFIPDSRRAGSEWRLAARHTRVDRLHAANRELAAHYVIDPANGGVTTAPPGTPVPSTAASPDGARRYSVEPDEDQSPSATTPAQRSGRCRRRAPTPNSLAIRSRRGLRSVNVIGGAHTIIFAEDAERARVFLRDVLGLEGVDAGDGWLIFALPPGELAVHPGSGWGRGPGHHALFFMCHDIEQTVEQLEAKGVEFVSPIEDEAGAGSRGSRSPARARSASTSPSIRARSPRSRAAARGDPDVDSAITPS